MEDNRNFMEDNKFYKRKKKASALIILAIVFAIIGGVIGSTATNFYFMNKYKEVEKSESSANNITITAKEDSTVAKAVAKKAMSSVVGITTSGVQATWVGPVEVQGTGSGIIVDSKGYIVTNAHVVKLNNQIMKKVKVQLDNEETVDGETIWADENVDLAIVKINTKTKLTVASLGDSDKLQIGDVAIAIGNPISLQFNQSVTQGIISGLNRYVGEVSGGGYMVGLIQTDASINGGNSGGPLLNANGEVIGINTVKVQSAEGLGFSIPINYVKKIIREVIETGDYKEMSLGIYSLDAKYAEQVIGKDPGTENGILVIKVFDGSPAKIAGLEVGDIITKIGKYELNGVKDLKAALYNFQEGDKTDITFIRNGKEMKAELVFTNYEVPQSESKNGQKNNNSLNVPDQNLEDDGMGESNDYQDPFSQYRDQLRQFFGE